jgi:hypothetical protein
VCNNVVGLDRRTRNLRIQSPQKVVADAVTDCPLPVPGE